MQAFFTIPFTYPGGGSMRTVVVAMDAEIFRDFMWNAHEFKAKKVAIHFPTSALYGFRPWKNPDEEEELATWDWVCNNGIMLLADDPSWGLPYKRSAGDQGGQITYTDQAEITWEPESLTVAIEVPIPEGLANMDDQPTKTKRFTQVFPASTILMLSQMMALSKR